jgi:hypothetical protein
MCQDPQPLTAEDYVRGIGYLLDQMLAAAPADGEIVPVEVWFLRRIRDELLPLAWRGLNDDTR